LILGSLNLDNVAEWHLYKCHIALIGIAPHSPPSSGLTETSWDIY